MFLLGDSDHELAGIAADKFDITDIIKLSVDPGIADCLFIQFDSNYLFGIRTADNSDCSGSAIGINNNFLFCQAGIFDRFLIENFSLYGIYLIEGGR
ncbi:hypothetical protein SDC9_187957 [bioreactor metagenome]|uniref:Uncharacterized protein n=1 Tax=bioreactor metagenome TaxID=1076179 RepID=A0A645HNL2_9ZZZZ